MARTVCIFTQSTFTLFKIKIDHILCVPPSCPTKGYKDISKMLSTPKELGDRDQEMPTIKYQL